MGTRAQIKAVLDAGSYNSDPEIAAQELNTKSVEIAADVPSENLKQYFMLTDVWDAVKVSSDPAAIKTMDALSVFTIFRMSDPAVAAKVDSVLSALVAATPQLMTQTQKDTLLAMTKAYITPMQAAGLSKATAGIVARARAI